MTRLRLRLLTSGFTLLLLLPVAEIVARAVYGEGFLMLADPEEDHRYRPFLDYEQEWNGSVHRFYSNDLGWKDEGPGRIVAKRPRHERILVLGDSFAEGLGCAYKETLGEHAERALWSSGRAVEVLNGGRTSFCPLLEYQRLKKFLAAGYRADRLVLLLDLSDLQDQINYSSRYARAADGEPIRLSGWRYTPIPQAFYNHSALVRSLDRLQGSLRGSLRQRGRQQVSGPEHVSPRLRPNGPPLSVQSFLALPGTSYRALRPNWLAHPPSLRGWVGEAFALTFADLLRIRRLAESQGMPFLLVIYPWPQMLYTREDPAYYAELREYFGWWYEERELVLGRRTSPRITEYQRQVHAFCRAHGIPLLDLIPEIQNAERWHELYLRKDVHFNDRGNRLLGERLAQFLRKEP